MHCSNCGSENSNDASYCARCGAKLGDPAQTEVVDRNCYGGFWRRCAALILDSLILFIPFFILALLLVAGSAELARHQWIVNLLNVAAAWLYFASTRSSKDQASPGQRALHLKVTDLQGHRISFARATGLYFASWVSGLTLGIGYLVNLFSARRQTLHDMMAGTLVYRSEVDPLAPGKLVPAEGLKGWAIALIVLGCMVPIGGILAAIAIPAYADYTLRARVQEGVARIAAYKAAVERSAAGGTPWADISSDTLGPIDSPTSAYVQRISVDESMIQLTFSANANRLVEDATLSFTPAISDKGEVTWICGYAPPPAGFTAVRSDYVHFSSMPRKYLSISCR